MRIDIKTRITRLQMYNSRTYIFHNKSFDLIGFFDKKYVYRCTHIYFMNISLDTDELCVPVFTVINVEWVGLQDISIISACSVAKCCGNSVKHPRKTKSQTLHRTTPTIRKI